MQRFSFNGELRQEDQTPAAKTLLLKAKTNTKSTPSLTPLTHQPDRKFSRSPASLFFFVVLTVFRLLTKLKQLVEGCRGSYRKQIVGEGGQKWYEDTSPPLPIARSISDLTLSSKHSHKETKLHPAWHLTFLSSSTRIPGCRKATGRSMQEDTRGQLPFYSSE